MLSWTIHLLGGPQKHYHAAVAVGHKLYSFGGDFCEGRAMKDMVVIDVYVFNTVSLRWNKLPAETTESGKRPLEVPSMCWGHTAALIEDSVYIWGGLTTYELKCFNVLYAFDVDTHRWFKPDVSGTVPEARWGHSACVLGKVMYVFGGCMRQQRRCNLVYTLDTATMVWSLINTGGQLLPLASLCHSATIVGKNMFVFGGKGDQWDQYRDNIRVFDTETNLWLSTPPPCALQPRPDARMRHTAFAYNGELYIYGGDNTRETFSDLWKFNPETVSFRKVEPKGKGPSTRMSRTCCCTVGDRIVIFGGYGTYMACTGHHLYILDLSPSLKTLCKVAFIRCGLKCSGLPQGIRWELAAMTTNTSTTSAHQPSPK